MFRILILLFLVIPAIAGPILDSLRVDNINIDTNTISSLNTNGNVTVAPNGTGKLDVQGRLDVTSTSYSSRPCPSMTSAQRDAVASPVAGDCVYNSTSTKLDYYNGSAWGEVGAGGSPSFSTVTKTTTATLAVSGEDNVIVDATSGSFTVTLPTAVGNSGLTYKITKKTFNNLVTIDGNGSETIGGTLTVILAAKDDSIIIASDGSNWYYLSDDVEYSATYKSDAGTTINTASTTNVLYNTVVYDPRTMHATGTGVTTVPVAGRYEVCYLVTYTLNTGWSGAEYALVYIEINGTIDHTNYTYPNAANVRAAMAACDVFDLNASDTVEITTRQVSGGSIALENGGGTDDTHVKFSIKRL